MDYCDGRMVAVKSGDTLYSISMKYNVPLAVLLRANPYVDVYNLQVGETICVPVRKEEQNERMQSQMGDGRKETVEGSLVEGLKELPADDREENRERIQNARWERHVTQPGDTLNMVIADHVGDDDDWEDMLKDFVERNGMDRIYLLPGMAYFRKKR